MSRGDNAVRKTEQSAPAGACAGGAAWDGETEETSVFGDSRANT